MDWVKFRREVSARYNDSAMLRLACVLLLLIAFWCGMLLASILLPDLWLQVFFIVWAIFLACLFSYVVVGPLEPLKRLRDRD